MAIDHAGHVAAAPTLGAAVVIGGSRVARESLAERLRHSGRFDRVSRVGDYASSLAMLASSPPQAALVSAGLSDEDGLAAAGPLKRMWPVVGVVLVDASGPHRLREAIEAGLDGFYLDDAPVDDLVRGMRLVRAGGLAIDSRVRRHLFSDLFDSAM